LFLVEMPRPLQHYLASARARFPEASFRFAIWFIPAILVLGALFVVLGVVAIQHQFAPGAWGLYLVFLPLLVFPFQGFRINRWYRDRRSRQALQLLSHAGKGGSREALELGKALLHGRRGLPKDEVSAMVHLGRAAQGGEKEAMLLLASNYRQGIGVFRDVKTAEAWERRALESSLPADDGR
jgi:TPR repeat protein